MSDPSEPRLLRLLKTVTQMADLLPRLHEELIAAAGGVSSVLLVLDRRSRELRPLSGYRVASLPLEPWLTSPVETRAVAEAVDSGSPVVLKALASAAPHLQEALAAPAAVVQAVPVADTDPAVLVVGLENAPQLAKLAAALEPVAAAFGLALERARLEREVWLQRELRQLLHAFTRAAAAKLDVGAGLSVICDGAVRLFGADRATLWLHERRTRELVCRGTSGPRPRGSATRVSVEDALSVAATTLRRPAAEIVMSREDASGLSVPSGLAIPLRGRRRALGTLIIDGVRVEPGDTSDVLARADELGRQLAAAIENVQLLEDVIASRRPPREPASE
jgi:hypothetical protein